MSSRWLTCPRCKFQFLHYSRTPRICPQCGYGSHARARPSQPLLSQPDQKARQRAKRNVVAFGCAGFLLAAAVLIIIGVVLVAGGNLSKFQTSSNPSSWQTLKTWQGSEDQQTEIFTTPVEWRIIWSDTVTSDVGGAFTLGIYTSDGRPAQLVTATQKTNPDTTYNVHASPGSFYLKIGTANVTYKVEVQVLK